MNSNNSPGSVIHLFIFFTGLSLHHKTDTNEVGFIHRNAPVKDPHPPVSEVLQGRVSSHLQDIASPCQGTGPNHQDVRNNLNGDRLMKVKVHLCNKCAIFTSVYPMYPLAIRHALSRGSKPFLFFIFMLSSM